MSSELETRVLDTALIKTGDLEYTVTFPFSAVAAAEKKLDGLSLRDPRNWFRLTTEQLPVVLWAGLLKHQPNVTEAEALAICEAIGPEQISELHYNLCKLAVPGYCTLVEEVAKREGAPDPKAQSGDGS